MKRYIAFSGGVESTAMCVLYGKGATAVFTDTGSEHAYLYKRLDEVEQKLKKLHDGDFELIRVKPFVKVGDKTVNSLTDLILEKKYFPSKQHRFCTAYFKIDVMDKFLSDKGECELLIGLNADEARVGNFGLLANVNYRTPLKEDGHNRQDCIDILNSVGLNPKFPPYMRRGGCIFCPFKSKKEYKAMVHLAPEEINLVKMLEEAVQDKRGKYFRIKQDMPSMADFIAIEQNNLFGDLSDQYADNEEQYSCGVFCHR